MSKFTEGSLFFKKRVGSYADGWGEVTDENRNWEDAYRDRWAHDKIVRSTHGVNCTGSCSWKIYVKDGIVTWETQQTDYPPTPCGVPNHEPRGCPRGAGYSWYLYSAARVKHPLIRAQLRDAWRRERAHHEPLEAWKRIVEDPETRESYVKVRGLGDLVRTSWDEATEIIAAANLYTIEKYGPDRIAGFSPIPGYSMVSYGAGVAICRSSAQRPFRSTTGIATFHLRHLKPSESKRTCPSRKHGTTPTTSSAGARTSP